MITVGGEKKGVNVEELGKKPIVTSTWFGCYLNKVGGILIAIL